MIALALACFLLAAAAHAQSPPVDRVAFSPPGGAALPRDAAFADEHGRRVLLGDYLDERPVIVVPAYFGCSNLCGLVARGLAFSLAASRLVAGRDVEVIVVSIDSRETSADALARKQEIVGPSAEGWHFLVGGESSVAALTRALGYRYVYDEHDRQYAHAAGIVLAAPDGTIRDTMYGVAYAPEALRAGVRGAAPPPVTTAWLLCFHYDPTSGRYTLAAMNAARLAAGAALIALAAFIVRSRQR
jgi:protein SCO1/2